MPSQYLTVAELLAAPLGLALRSIPAPGSGGPAGVSGVQTYEELTNLIVRASTMADSYCQQVLGATQDSEEKRTDGGLAGVDQHGYLWVHTDYWPVLAVVSFAYAYPATGGTLWTSVSTGDLIVERTRIVYPASLPRCGVPPLRVRYTYCHGWPNTTLAASVAAGATALPVADATGVAAGQQLTIGDQGNSEVVTAAADWAPATGPASVALAAGTAFAHTPVFRPAPPPAQPYNIAVSTLPADIKEAVLLIVKALVETRGTNALVMGRAGGLGASAPAPRATAETAPPTSQRILDRYRRLL